MRVKAIGRIELLPDSIKDVLSRLDNVTKEYDNHFLNIAIAYGGQNELVDAVRKIGDQNFPISLIATCLVVLDPVMTFLASDIGVVRRQGDGFKFL